MGKVATVQTRKTLVLVTTLGKETPQHPQDPTSSFLKRIIYKAISSDHDLRSLLRVAGAQISQALLLFSLRRPYRLSRFPVRKMSSCWIDETLVTGQFQTQSHPNHQEIQGYGKSISLKLDSSELQSPRQKESWAPSAQCFLGLWFVALGKVSPLPDGALCPLNCQMVYESRKPKVSFHLEKA